MATLILRFKGAPESRHDALELLRQQLPRSVLTPKTDTLVEAQLDDSLLPALQSLNVWEATLPTFADAKAPSVDWARIRDELID